MKLPEMSEDTFLLWAREEACQSISAGRLHGVFHRKEAAFAEGPVPITKFAFGALISLQRRRNQWTVEELAAKAQIDLEVEAEMEGAGVGE